MEQKERISKRMEDSLTEQVRLVRASHLNGAGRLFGGMLVQWIDEVAGIVAKRHSEMNIITASIDNLRFMKGAYVNDVIVLIGRVTYVGTSSMEVRVDTYVEGSDGMRKPINRAYLVMVALDEQERPAMVPDIVIETESQKAEWEGAKKRREVHKRRRTEGF